MTRFPDDAFVAVAEIVRAVGLRGEVKLYPLLDWYEPLLDADVLVRGDGSALEIERWRAVSGGVVVRIAGISDRDEAESVVGERIGFLRGRYRDAGFPRPAGGLPFRYVGREVVTRTGEEVGVVDEVRLYGPQFTLVIPAQGGEILIPAVAPILVENDELEGPLVIDPPEGLLDAD